MNYLNEFDPQAAAWLRELRDNKLIPPCDIDTRSIEDVEPRELAGYTQCHFFAGIGGWPLALQLAGWPADRPIWTGSCPCQPFSAAGKCNGFDDERHLWPAFHWLIEQCRPTIVLGEQVASAAVGPWIDLVLTDLEALGYASGAYAGPAAGVGAPHIRDRSYWVAYTNNASQQSLLRSGANNPAQDIRGCASVQPQQHMAQRFQGESARLREPPQGDTSALDSHWRNSDWLRGRDGYMRPVQPGTFPLADGVPRGLDSHKGYGNAIVPQQAAEFVKAVMAYSPSA